MVQGTQMPWIFNVRKERLALGTSRSFFRRQFLAVQLARRGHYDLGLLVSFFVKAARLPAVL